MDKNVLVKKLNQAKNLLAECLEDLSEGGEKVLSENVEKKDDNLVMELDFSKPIRPFAKEYIKDKSGPKKFTLLVAYFTKGDIAQSVLLSKIEKQWNKMRSLLGSDFNRFYPSQAKDNDWVGSPKPGLYTLRPGWKSVLK